MSDDNRGDLHSNAHLEHNQILISEELLKHHNGHDDEILAIIAHELGHWQMKHVRKLVLINIAYIVTFFVLMIPVIDNDAFLVAFNFHH